MCVLVLTRGNGTPFDPASIQEEDIIVICIWLGHTHPEVMLFYSADEMLVMACGVIKVTTLHEESIKLRTSPPHATHVRAYMVIMEGEPSGAQPATPTPDREEEPHPSPSDPNPGGKTPHQLQANLEDLGDAELWHLMEDLCWEVAHRELNVSPRDPPPTPWGNPVGNRDPDVDDQEVTFLRGGGCEPRGQPL